MSLKTGSVKSQKLQGGHSMKKRLFVVAVSCLTVLMFLSSTGSIFAREGNRAVESAVRELDEAVAKSSSEAGVAKGALAVNFAIPVLSISLLLTAGSVVAYRRLRGNYQAKGSVITAKLSDVIRKPFTVDEEAFAEMDHMKEQIHQLTKRAEDEEQALKSFRNSL